MKRHDQRKSHRPPNPFLQPEIDAHNAQVDARKAAKLERKVARLVAGRKARR